jgi:hypothetical protein
MLRAEDEIDSTTACVSGLESCGSMLKCSLEYRCKRTGFVATEYFEEVAIAAQEGGVLSVINRTLTSCEHGAIHVILL